MFPLGGWQCLVYYSKGKKQRNHNSRSCSCYQQRRHPPGRNGAKHAVLRRKHSRPESTTSTMCIYSLPTTSTVSTIYAIIKTENSFLRHLRCKIYSKPMYDIYRVNLLHIHDTAVQYLRYLLYTYDMYGIYDIYKNQVKKCAHVFLFLFLLSPATSPSRPRRR